MSDNHSNDVGTSVNDLIVVELYGTLFVCECIGTDGEYHREVKSRAALESGVAFCRACATLRGAAAARREQRRREQIAIDAGNI